MTSSESPRILKIRSLLVRDLGEIFNLMGHKFYAGVMFTVTTVRITPDLSIAKVYLSMFPTNDKEAVLGRITENASTIRYELGKRIGKQMRIVPELKFFIDDSLDYIEKIDDLLNK